MKKSDLVNYNLFDYPQKRLSDDGKIILDTVGNSSKKRYFIDDEEYVYADVIKEEELHKAGDTVNVKNYKVNGIINELGCTSHENYILCPKENLTTFNTDYGLYSYDYNESTMLMDDPQTMNFKNISYNGWDENIKDIGFITPSTFTMPKHDVVILVIMDLSTT